MYQHNFLAKDRILKRLSEMGDPLEKITKYVDFELFRPALEKTVIPHNRDYTKGGRPRFDAVMMFKILLIEDWYNISNDRVEYLINDRLSFQRFLNLTIDEKVPDANTIWDFREALSKSGADKELFELFTKLLEEKGIIKHEGSIVDATFVDVPRQRNTREENRQIKEEGQTPKEWQGKPHKLAQKDVDARWTKKNDEVHYGYKDHVKVDEKTKLIVCFEVSDASVHDSQKFLDVLDKSDNKVYADSAYIGVELHAQVHVFYPDLVLMCCERGFRNKPLTLEQKVSNRLKSKVRARVEHVFGFMSVSMGGIFVRTIGLVRAKAQMARCNLAYNLKRYVFLAGARLISVL
jgi:IS5 family transposase